MPTPEFTDEHNTWIRVVCDGSSVAVYAQRSATEPAAGAAGWTGIDPVFTSSSFDLSGGGGMIGFNDGTGSASIDNFRLWVDTDAPEYDGVADTLAHEERFTLSPTKDDYVDVEPTHDAAGNLTFDGRFAYAYDAWNRQVRVTKAWRDDSGTLHANVVVSESQYDGLGRRIVKAVRNSADLDATYHYYYDQHSIIEVRNGSDAVLKQHVWGPTSGGAYVDELVQTSINDDPADGSEQDVETHYFAMQDANFNVQGMMDASGVLVERYEYTPYGERHVYVSAGTNDPLAYTPTTISQRVELPGNVTQPYGLNPIGHQGLMHDEVTGLVYNRARMLHPRLGRFAQRDPLDQNDPGGGYQDGMNRYQYVRSNPIVLRDPSGLFVSPRHGRCCNSSNEDEWALVDDGSGAKWHLLQPGDCIGSIFTSDCEGMTCGGGFYKVSGLSIGTCRTPGCDKPPYNKRRWTPNDQDSDAESPSNRGSSEGDTPPGYQYKPRECDRHGECPYSQG